MNFEKKEVEYVDHEDPRFNYTSTVVVVKGKDPTCHLSGSKYPVAGTYSLDQLTELAREIREHEVGGCERESGCLQKCETRKVMDQIFKFVNKNRS